MHSISDNQEKPNRNVVIFMFLHPFIFLFDQILFQLEDRYPLNALLNYVRQQNEEIFLVVVVVFFFGFS
jgi:hypothetical protein